MLGDLIKSKKFLIVFGVLVLIIFVIVILLPDNKKPVSTPKSTSVVITPQAPIKELNGKTKVILQAVNNSEREGWLIIQEYEGKTWLNINIDADEIAEDDHDFPATLRSGSCASLGGIQQQLTPVYNGGSETTLPMNFEVFKTMLPLSLVVEQSPTDPTIVACGDISSVYY